MCRTSIFIGIVFLLIAFAGCNTSTKLVRFADAGMGVADFDYWIHSPLHPDTRQEVTFRTRVSDPAGIDRIALYVYEYELFLNEDGLPSKRRRTDSQWGLVYDWEYESTMEPVSVAFPFVQGFRSHSNIEYIFVVHNSKGEVSEKMALFDAGESPWGHDKITLYATSRNTLINSINLCLVPDTDYKGDWRGFLTDMEKMVYSGFHENNKIKEHKSNWHFYYTRQEVDGQAISENYVEETVFPDFLRNDEIQGIDAFGLMHRKPYGDGTYLKNNLHFLTYNLFTSESYNFGTAIHEAAHAVFNLSDEYDLCACFEHPEGANVFSSLQKCQEFNVKNGFPINDCSPLQHLNGQNWYMSEYSPLFSSRESCEAFNMEKGYTKGSCEKFKDYDGTIYFRALEGLCIMQDDGDDEVRDFKRTCARIIDHYYEKLNAEPVVMLSAGILDEAENIFDYQPVLNLEILQLEGQLAFNVKGIKQGIPNKNLLKRDAIRLDFLTSSNDNFFSISLPDPGYLHIHRADQSDEQIYLPEVKMGITIPYVAEMETLICRRYPSGGVKDNEKQVNISRVNLSQQIKDLHSILSTKN